MDVIQCGKDFSYHRTMRGQRKMVRSLRYAVQLFFFVFTLFIGYQFHQFVAHFENPSYPYVERPASVEAFLPIAGLMSFKYFVFMGMVEPIHPAAFVMFVAILAVSVLAKKGFCGWICPIGTLSQYFWMAGEKIFRKNFVIEKFTDPALRSVKYILMALFLIAIGIAMSPNMMVLFFLADYYKAVDVRMLTFFTDMSKTTFWVLLSLGILSLLYKNFFCRYLCPYGALLGLLSCVGPVKVRRDEAHCVHCRACSRHCPSMIDVEKKELVSSPECYGCLTCVSRCPSEGALDMTVAVPKKRVVLNPYLYPVILLVCFYLVIGAGMAAGKWHSQMPEEEYRRIITEMSAK